MTDQPTYVDYAFADGLARITLVDADHGNSVHTASLDALHRAVGRARSDGARVVLLASTGRFFSVGGDLGAFSTADDVGGYIDDLADALHRVISELMRSDAIVVSAVQGVAAGAGFPLAAAADVVLAARSVKFTLGYAKVGLSVDGGTSLLTHSLGLHRTLRLALLHDAVTAEEALAAGLVARVYDDEAALAQGAEEVVAGLLAGAPRALAATKRLLRETVEPAPETRLRAETLSIRERAASAEGREGVAAFTEKRAPRFGG